MPLLPIPSTEELEDHFFGSGAFSFGWFTTNSDHFPATVDYWEDATVLAIRGPIEVKTITEDMFNEGIMTYADMLPDRTYQDLIEDMDAADVDAIIQLIFWGEIRLS